MLRGEILHSPIGIRGITLLELMVVIMILAIMTVFVVPNMRGLRERNKLVSASRQIVSLIRYARTEAITGERETEIRFDVEGGRYRLDLNRYIPSSNGSWSRSEKKRSEFEHIRHLPHFVYFKEVATDADPDSRGKIGRVVFYPDGSATGATIVLENRPPRKKGKTRYMTIEVPPATALPEVYNKTPEELAREQDKAAREAQTEDESYTEENGVE